MTRKCEAVHREITTHGRSEHPDGHTKRQATPCLAGAQRARGRRKRVDRKVRWRGSGSAPRPAPRGRCPGPYAVGSRSASACRGQALRFGFRSEAGRGRLPARCPAGHGFGGQPGGSGGGRPLTHLFAERGRRGRAAGVPWAPDPKLRRRPRLPPPRRGCRRPGVRSPPSRRWERKEEGRKVEAPAV
jgi:hypothetical protein